jgi:hypothetical protein
MAPEYGARDNATLAMSQADREMPWQLMVRLSAAAGALVETRANGASRSARAKRKFFSTMMASFFAHDSAFQRALHRRFEKLSFFEAPRASCTQKLFAGMKLAISKKKLKMGLEKRL